MGAAASSCMTKSKVTLLITVLTASNAFAGNAGSGSDADINLPQLQDVSFWSGQLASHAILYFGLAVCAIGAAFGFWTLDCAPCPNGLSTR